MPAAYKLHQQAENFTKGCCPTCGKPSDEADPIFISGSTVIRAGDCVRLSEREARLFEKLLKSWPNVVHKDALMAVLWPNPDDEPPSSQDTIRVYMTYLRKKLAPLGLGVTFATWSSPFYRAEILKLEALKAAS